MPNNPSENIRKKTLFERADLCGQALESPQTESKWALFKAVFFNKFGTMVGLNLLTALFALPGAAVIVLFYVNSTVATSLLPYSANFGIGYPVTVNVDAMGTLTAFGYTLYEFLLLIPCIALLAVGVSGNLFVMNKLVGGEQAKMFKDFFRGIKKSGLSAFFIGLVFGCIVASVALSLGYFDAYGLHVGYKAATVTVTIAALVFATLFVPFFMTQGACFKLKAGVRLKNSAAMLFGAFLPSLAMTAIAVAPLFTAFIPGFTMFYVMIFALLGISYTTLVFTLHCRQCFSICAAIAESAERSKPKSEEANIKERIKESDGADTAVKKKQPPAQYKNPKKKKREESDR